MAGELGSATSRKIAPWARSATRSQKRGTDATAAPGGIDGQVEDFRLVGSALAPGAESSGLVVDQGYENREACIIAQRPLRSFRAVLLNAGDGAEIALRRGPDQDGLSRAAQT